MSWKEGSESILKRVYLDTNALSEISKNINGCQKGFFEKFPPEKFTPCFSVYNLRELKQATAVYERFSDFFSNYSFAIVSDYGSIAREEIRVYYSDDKPNIFIYEYNHTVSENPYEPKQIFTEIWNSEIFMKQLEIEDKNIDSLAQKWGSRRIPISNHILYGSLPDAIFNQNYQTDNVNYILSNIEPKWIKENFPIKIIKFPSLRMIIFSHYKKVFQSKVELKKNDVFDVMISSVTPYVDAIVTESNQADVFKQAKKYINQLNKLSIVKLKDLRRVE